MAEPQQPSNGPLLQRPVRVGLVLDGSELYGVREIVRSLAAALDPGRIELTGLFFGAGGGREAIAPFCARVVDLHAGCLCPLTRPGRPRLDLLNLLQKAGSATRGVLGLARAARQLKLDLLHPHIWPVHAVAGLAGRLARVRSLWHWHSVTAPSWNTRAAEACMTRLADEVVCISRFVASELPPAVQPRCRIVYNGLDTRRICAAQRRGALRERAGVSADTPLVGIFGSLTAYKGHEYFLRAAATVVRTVPHAHFVIVGDESAVQRHRIGLEAKLRKLVAELGLGSRVTFTGALPEACLYMGDCDVVCMPTVPLGIRGEGFGLVAAEAMAAGVAVVASNLGGQREMITPGQDGLLVPPAYSAALAEAVRSLLVDPASRERLARAGQATVQARFDIAQTARTMESVYIAAAAARAARRPAQAG